VRKERTAGSAVEAADAKEMSEVEKAEEMIETKETENTKEVSQTGGTNKIDKTNKTISLTEGSIWRGILLFTLPVIASNYFQQFYSLVDSVVVGRVVGSEALAAVSAVMPVIHILINLFLGITTGAGVVAAIYIGAGDKEALSQTVHTSMVLGVVCGLVMTVIGIGLSPYIPVWMNFSDETRGLATQYLISYFLGILPMLMYNMGSSILRASGDSRRPFYALVAGGFLNCVLDILFVAFWNGGVVGAGLASSLAQLISAALVLWWLMREKSDCRLCLKELRMEKRVARQIIRIGVPTGMSTAMFSIANTVMQSKLNLFGTAAMAGTGAYLRLDGFMYTLEGSFGLTATTFTGQNMGAGQMERVRKGAHAAMVYGFACILPLTAAYLIFARQLLGIFSDDPEVIDYGVQLMRFMAPFAWVCVFSEILGAVPRGAGSAMPSMMIQILTVCVARILILTVVLPVWYDIRTIYLCYPVTWVLSSICFALYYWKGNWAKGLKN